MYAYGQGAKQDYFMAKELFGKACDAGHAKGCKNYAILNKAL
jgi:TPR repeat protein